ncbi:trypsin-like serine protease [Patulibacter americanus]|uniref:trypsin-like serine protease n=1 Tax=Patulibacter americanus TaxID=588672 RepID=UPI0003B41F55|nr:trypsin-like serine protease [Patulibacter americanus]
MTNLRPSRRALAAASSLPLALLAFGAAASPAHAIVGGQTARTVAPYDGSFQRVDSPRRSTHVCGATLIAPRWAITAGHCTNEVDTKTSLAGTGKVKIALSGNPVGWKVRFGSRDNISGGRLVNVQQFVRASRTIDPAGDYALLKLSRPVRVTPAKVATRPPAPGTTATIQGWGYTNKGGLRDYGRTRSYPTMLRAAITKVARLKTCGIKADRRALCIGVDERVGPDNMDSGGPVFVQERGHGTVIAGTVNGGNYVSGLRPSVYTDLSAHRRWISSYTSGRRAIPRPKRLTSPGMAGAAVIHGSGCSASVVRVAASRPTDPAMVLTNGHCLDPRPKPGQAVADRPSDSLVPLTGRSSNPIARGTTTRLLYATMTGTDVALYRLRQSYAELAALDVPARELATTGPAPGDALVMHSGTAQTTFACTVETVVPAVQESGYTQRNALRYAADKACLPQGGTSGSPMVNPRTDQIVAIHNSHVTGDGKPCTESNPCEVAPDGTTTAVKDRGYAQQVTGLTACIAAGSVFDAARPGCTVTAARR